MKIPKTGLSRVVEVIACAISIGALLNNANVNVIYEVMIIQQGGSPQLRSIFIVTLIFIGILVYLMSVYIAKNKKLNLIERVVIPFLIMTGFIGSVFITMNLNYPEGLAPRVDINLINQEERIGTYQSVHPLVIDGSFFNGSTLGHKSIEYKIIVPEHGNVFAIEISRNETEKIYISGLYTPGTLNSFTLKEMETKRFSLTNRFASGYEWAGEFTDGGMELTATNKNENVLHNVLARM
ncbi:hypothetical protein AB4455_07395 [Vibrio sp. 10N.261.46.E12]|uniref:hypothetical protein n=1 Tax=unclassified Vibrio TaxID=2614977 RepID=UPI000976512C|nr:MULTISPECIES: hypothetical protein [unclassified Vibrio]PML97439.1 hypothetical protein BCT66_21175 [Vibrio sp. 10N.261.49.E11]PMM76571.1 hypothetical protein BCT48_02030 [Vibrio sp. 10N.261.46.F12]OMO36451.1 hypothetical protein BH584_03985 [Vibrio sp. 10N.261.45.E1]PMJ22117.1 hypothetical protein BCU27_17025 [Vibrio sp. 10N.286.45.B6]PMM86895.1 hypothetical protein BCT46_06945 [Vibrio sp. 10N.261.46.E8]